METEDLIELEQEAREKGYRVIGVTMAITAALLATVTLMGHRLHTEEVVMQTKSADGWSYFQAKNNRSHMYGTDAKLAELIGTPAALALVAEWSKKSVEERQQAEQIRVDTEKLEHETEAAAHRATYFDLAEICLEVGIVLSSISLLTKSALFWRLGFVPIAIGVVIGGLGLVGRF
jgi:Domain of unknown function (DUF4337)